MTVRLIVLWMSLGVLAAFGLYNVKYRVQAMKLEVAAIETQLREEKKNLHVLAAEWTYLNRPERLHRLSAKYLHLKPVSGRQLSDLISLPAAPVALAQVEEQTKGKTPAEKNGAVLAGETGLGGGVRLAGAEAQGAFHAR